MTLSITSIKLNENNTITGVTWEWTTSNGRVVGDHTIQNPSGVVNPATLTASTVASLVSGQLDTSGLNALATANGFRIPTVKTYDVLSGGGLGSPEFTSGFSHFIAKVLVKASDHPNYGDGSANYYDIGSLVVGNNTVLYIDQSDSSNAGHPIAFYTDENKTTAYTTGVTTVGTAGSAGAYVTLNILSSTPSPLYYQCTNHAKMGSSITVESTY